MQVATGFLKVALRRAGNDLSLSLRPLPLRLLWLHNSSYMCPSEEEDLPQAVHLPWLIRENELDQLQFLRKIWNHLIVLLQQFVVHDQVMSGFTRTGI